MTEMKMDPSLAEVRRWRQEAQRELEQLDSASRIAQIHDRAQRFMKEQGLDLKIERLPTREKMAH